MIHTCQCAYLTRMQSIVVFCGSSAGHQSIYRDTAYEVGAILAGQNIKLVYGGARVGLMGAVADGALDHGGAVVGVIPTFLKTKEVVHERLSLLYEVSNMHERKMKMHELSEGVIAMPGGWGTMEELFEIMTWGQLGLHRKPIGILNVAGYYDAFLGLLERMVQDGFLNEVFQGMLVVSEDIIELLSMMRNYAPPVVPKWIHKNEV